MKSNIDRIRVSLFAFVILLSAIVQGRSTHSIDLRMLRYCQFITFFGFSPAEYQSESDGTKLKLVFLCTDTMKLSISDNQDSLDLLIKTKMLLPRQYKIEGFISSMPNSFHSSKIGHIIDCRFKKGDTIAFDQQYLTCQVNGHVFTIVPNSFDVLDKENKRKYKPVNKELIHKADSLLKDSTVLSIADTVSIKIFKRVLELVDNSAE